MIERAVFSYFNPEESFRNKAGFYFYSDFLYTTALAAVLASRVFKEVHFITSSWGEKVLKGAGIPATVYTNEFDSIKHISPWFWAYGKLVAYNLQSKPFVHIDNDVFLWKKLPERILEANLCFQSKEFLDIPNYKWYALLKPCWNAALVRPQIIVDNEITDFTYNCGICGGNNLEFFKEWIKCSSEYIFAPENNKLFFEQYRSLLLHQNLFHEQYFAASLVKARNLRDKVEVISDDSKDLLQATNNGFTHLWGVTKRNQITMKKVRMKLIQEDELVFDRVSDFVDKYLKTENVETKKTYK